MPDNALDSQRTYPECPPSSNHAPMKRSRESARQLRAECDRASVQRPPDFHSDRSPRTSIRPPGVVATSLPITINSGSTREMSSAATSCCNVVVLQDPCQTAKSASPPGRFSRPRLQWTLRSSPYRIATSGIRRTGDLVPRLIAELQVVLGQLNLRVPQRILDLLGP